MRKEKVLCFDIETTGNSPLRDEILQLTVVNGNRQIMFNEYFRPRWIKDWENPVITPADASQRQTFSQSSTQLQRLLFNADLIVGYNCERYSLAFLEQAGLSVPVPSFDVMREYSALYGLNVFLPLRDCCVHYGQDHYNWLLCFDRAKAAMDCFDGLIRDGGWTVTPTEIHPPENQKGLRLPTEEEINKEAERAIDAYEAEFGADGFRAFRDNDEIARTDAKRATDPVYHQTGEMLNTPGNNYRLTDLSIDQMKASGYRIHHAVGDGKHLIMSNGTRDFAVRIENETSEKPIPTKHNTGMKL